MPCAHALEQYASEYCLKQSRAMEEKKMCEKKQQMYEKKRIFFQNFVLKQNSDGVAPLLSLRSTGHSTN
jgi:hypothetical protein